MSKEFNFPAFVENFGRIVDNEIKAYGGRREVKKAGDYSLLADECIFYTCILYFGGILTYEDMLTSCRDLFDRNQDIVCNDQLYKENLEQYRNFAVDINSVIKHELEIAECYTEEQKECVYNSICTDNFNNQEMLIGEAAAQCLN